MRCPVDGGALSFSTAGYRCEAGHVYPEIRGIPRFVDSDKYVGSFSFEWNTHRDTQLDSVQGSSSSEQQFRLKTGFTPEQLTGRLVLDAGVGAGRYSDVMVRWGARVVGVDLSFAVEAAWGNLGAKPNFVVMQADIGALPFAPETFDRIVSIGVLHHTSDTRSHFLRLVPLLKHGGEMAIWVYPNVGDYEKRARWIPFTRRIPSRMFYQWCRWFVPLALRHKTASWVRYISREFPFSDQGLGLENDILDTFDGYSPWFHGVHSPEEVMGWFREAGLESIHQRSDWLTCVRGRKP